MGAQYKRPALAEIETEIAAAEAAVKAASIAKVVAERDVQTATHRLEDAFVRLGKARHWLYMVKEESA